MAVQPSEGARGLYASLSTYLQQLGLGELAPIGGSGNPSGWLWSRLLQGVDTPDELQIAIEQTDVWRNRFGVIVEQRNRAAKGEPVRVMTAEEVVAYESTAAQLFRQAGLPTWMRDSYGDFRELILNNVSASELAERLGQAWDRVRSIDPKIRDAFTEFYGVGQGDAALASWFLDPERTIANIDVASRAAYTAGLGGRYGIDIDRATAERIATQPLTEAGIDEGLRQVNQLSTVFAAGALERDSLGVEEGLASVFEGDGAANQRIERRVAGRRSNDQSSLGGAAFNREGLIGTRAAE
jgi:hypothetical protein